ncbi:EF-P 5-aminopentanol modification-associated protein YfmF [Vagococcus sp.]|uniref:EF-P 5-aminopentanol modification-associated protein YfmF n=1 Tax=Vagococcus sp. TaxID=1933889 RepID=UPI003F9975B8
MMTELNQHVKLHILPNNKYKTVRILVRFATPLDALTSSKRSLLASLLETNSLNFPTQTDLSKQLADLYGASFGIGVSRKGNEHYLTIGLNIINDQLVPNGLSVLESAVEFLKEIIFQPNISNNQFDEATFYREQENLVEYIHSIFDDKQSHASLSIQQLFFTNDLDQQTPSFGNPAVIKQETPSSLANYYQEMLANDRVDILVLGDVAEGYVQRCFKDFGFTDRPQELTTNLFYKQPFENIIQQKTENLPVVQSKLNIAYHCNVYYYDDLYFALLIFNGLFGGFPHSKLFMNVREKHSLAYYASSSFDSFRGYLTVQTGIDGTNRKKVLKLVNEQLKSLVLGNISEELLLQTKKMLINQYLLSLDNQSAILEQAYLRLYFDKANLSETEWIEKVNNVTIEDVQTVAENVKLQAVYFMEGGN